MKFNFSKWISVQLETFTPTHSIRKKFTYLHMLCECQKPNNKKKTIFNTRKLTKFIHSRTSIKRISPYFSFLLFKKKSIQNSNLIKSFISSRLARKTMTNAVCDLKKIMFDQINVHFYMFSFSF